MIGLDTNILVRYITRDNAREAGLAKDYIKAELSPGNPGYISLIV